MGNCLSSKKVLAHLEVVGECGGVNRLSLSRPCSKGGRHMLGSFIFPTAVTGPGHHRAAHRVAVPVRTLAKKDGTTPVRLDFLAGDNLVARREVPLAALLEGLRANKIGRRSALFFSLEGGQAGGATGQKTLEDIAVSFSRRRLENPKKETQASQTAKTVPTLVPQYHEAAQADHTVATLEPEVTHVDLRPKVTMYDLMTGDTWELPKPKDDQESEAVPTMPSPQRWDSPQYHLWNGREELHGTPSEREQEPVPQNDTESEAVPTLLSPKRWDSPQYHLRNRRVQPRDVSSGGEKEPVLSERSNTSPPKQGKASPRAGRGVCVPCMVDALLQCAQVLAFILFMHEVLLQWL